MKKLLSTSFVIIAACAFFCADAFADKPVIAIIGDSISEGIGIPEKLRAEFCYPAQLAKNLGESAQVKNFSKRGSCILRKGFRPYWKEKCYAQALKSNPNVIIILMGANDSNNRNWAFKDEFEKDLSDFVDSFSKLSSKPRVILCKPLPCFRSGKPNSVDGKILTDELTPIVEKVAKEKKLEVLDMYTIMSDKAKLMPDKVHPNKEGAKVLADYLAEQLVKIGVVKK